MPGFRKIKIPSDEKIVSAGMVAEALGMIIFSITFFIHLPWVMIICLPAGAGLVLIGIAAWAWMFFKAL